MGELQNVVSLNQIIKNNEVDKRINEQLQKKSDMYAGDFRRFEVYCTEQGLSVSFDSLKAYLLDTITSGLKISTFNRRVAGVKHFLINERGLEPTAEQMKAIALLRQMYDSAEYAKQKKVNGQKAKPKHEVAALIDKLDVRAKAIALFNLITACRPSEMVTIKIKDIDTEDSSVNVYMEKQKVWHAKRLTLECVNAIKKYISFYDLQPDDYLVGKVDKHNNYYSVQISETAYRKSIHKWLGFAPYTLRKTQITAMHDNGADLATIAKQSGHKNLETINKHYLNVADRTVDKYI